MKRSHALYQSVQWIESPIQTPPIVTHTRNNTLLLRQPYWRNVLCVYKEVSCMKILVFILIWKYNLVFSDSNVMNCVCVCVFFLFLGVRWDGVHLVRRPLIGLLYQPRMIHDDEYGAVGGMRIGRENRSTRRKPTPVPLYPPQIPHDLTWARTRAAAVGSRRLTAWAMARPMNYATLW
jgi:hypothetical protein